ncbi:MAG: KH domain-containing protein [Clostridia bacterium]
MKEMLETIIFSLIEDKEAMEITQRDSEKEISFEVKVASTDMGRVIGKQGRVAKAIRTMMKALAGKEHKKVMIEFIEK